MLRSKRAAGEKLLSPRLKFPPDVAAGFKLPAHTAELTTKLTQATCQTLILGNKNRLRRRGDAAHQEPGFGQLLRTVGVVMCYYEAV